MPEKYCGEHSRIKLKNGLCVACGELDYDAPKQDDTIMMEIAKLSSVIIIICIIIIVIGLYREP